MTRIGLPTRAASSAARRSESRRGEHRPFRGAKCTLEADPDNPVPDLECAKELWLWQSASPSLGAAGQPGNRTCHIGAPGQLPNVGSWRLAVPTGESIVPSLVVRFLTQPCELIPRQAPKEGPLAQADLARQPRDIPSGALEPTADLCLFPPLEHVLAQFREGELPAEILRLELWREVLDPDLQLLSGNHRALDLVDELAYISRP